MTGAEQRKRFVATVAGLWAVLFLLWFVWRPSEPTTQLVFTGPLQVLAVLFAYWWVYRREADRLEHTE